MDWLVAFTTLLTGYMVGSIPFGFLVARSRGVDIFAEGSGNSGATNVARVLGWRLGLFVFLLDFAKGALPVGLALAVGPLIDAGSWWHSGWLEVLTGLAAFLGHLYPLYLRFRGGKGVATGTGVVAVLLPIPTLVAFAVWLLVVLATRYVSLASVLASLVLFGGAVLTQSPRTGVDPATTFCALAAGLVLVKHRANLRRLVAGTESQIKEYPLMTALARSLHVVALGLWFGTTFFFSFVVALSLFASFEKLAQQPERPAWFPTTEAFARTDETIHGLKEQGSRAAGFAVGPIFGWYFLLQGVCGFIALVTALRWPGAEPGRRVHRWRLTLLYLAFACVLFGWPIEHHVSELRVSRNDATDAYLRAGPAELDSARDGMIAARAAFRRWHFYSLMLNLATIGLVGAALALGAHLPSPGPKGSAVNAAGP